MCTIPERPLAAVEMVLGAELRFIPYEVLEILRRGPEWSVVKCRDENGHWAAVKVANVPSTRVQQRLREEAALLWRLTHPGHNHVVKLLKQSAPNERAWHSMAWVNGVPLARRQRRIEHLPALFKMGEALAGALEYVHAFGIVHGDVAPTNVIVDEMWNATLIDFGGAVRLFDSMGARETGHGGDVRYGTPGYMAPERITDGVLDARSDLYSLGCLLYEQATGQPPFTSDSAEALARQHWSSKPQAASCLRPGLPRAFDVLVHSLLEKDPASRCSSATEVRTALAALDPTITLLPSAGPPRQATLHKARLVGREAELAVLEAAIDRTMLRRGGLVLVGGESGAGKTRLLNEVAAYARGCGFDVLQGQCVNLVPESGARSSSRRPLGPLLPLLLWVSDLQHSGSAARDLELQDALDVLEAYEPGLRAAHDRKPQATLPPELARARVLQSLATILRVASEQQPLLLVLDDVQWADDLSAAFLCSDQLSALFDSTLCIAVAYRADEIAEPLLQQLSAKASDMAHLGRLDFEQVWHLARGLLGQQAAPSSLADFLYRRSGGNPFLVVEYVYFLLHRPGAFTSLLAPSSFAAATLHLELPSGLKELFESRTSDVGPAARKVLELSAVLGSEFDSELLREVAYELGLARDVSDALWELDGKRLVERQADGRCRFVHDKLREAQLKLLDPELRQTLHARVADVLCRTGRTPSEAELGVHLAEAGLAARALPHLTAAAEHASERYANAEAVELYTSALEQLELAVGAAGEGLLAHAARLQLGEARADVLVRSGSKREGAQQYAAMADGAEPRVRARLLRKRGVALWKAHEYDAAATALTEAEWSLLDTAQNAAAEDPVGDPGVPRSCAVHHPASAVFWADRLAEPADAQEWLEIQQAFFWLHYFARRAGRVTETVLERMRPVVERHGTKEQRSMFFECCASHLMAHQRYAYNPEAINYARQAMAELGDGCAGKASEPRFVLGFSLVLGNKEDCLEAVASFEATLAELRPIGDPMLIARALIYKMIAHRRLGQAEQVEEITRLARGYCDRSGLTHYLAACLACEAWLRWRASDLTGAEHLAHQALATWRDGTHDFPFRWLATFIVLDVHHLRDDFEAARRALDDLLEPSQRRFEEPLAGALITARGGCFSSEPRVASRQLLAVIQAAHQSGYL